VALVGSTVDACEFPRQPAQIGSPPMREGEVRVVDRVEILFINHEILLSEEFRLSYTYSNACALRISLHTTTPLLLVSNACALSHLFACRRTALVCL